MSFYPHNVDYSPPVQPSGGGHAVTGGKVADLLKYEVAPVNTGTVNLHAAVTLDAEITKTAGTSVVLETAAATDVLLTVTVGTLLAVGDILKDDAKAEKVLVTDIDDAPIYTVQRAYRSTALATHAAGATWKTVGKTVALSLLATELAACPQLIQIKGVKAGGALTGDVTVYGTNIKHVAISDTMALADDAAVPGVKAFRSLVSMDLPLRTTAADTVSLGTVKTVGLPWYVKTADYCVVKLLDGSADAGSVTYDADEIEKNVYAVAGTPNGTKLLTLFIAH
jgi:hypothetical protein